MKKEDKGLVTARIAEALKAYPHFYLVDMSSLDAEKTMDLRKRCYSGGVKLMVVKNTLLRRALSDSDTDFSELYKTLKGNTALMLSENANAPAKIIKDFLKENKDLGKPALKAAYVQEGLYVGAEHLDALVAIKSREELIGEVVTLLQSPIKNVLSSLQSAGQTIHGVLKTLEER